MNDNRFDEELDRLERVFWRRVDKTDDCWIWTGAVTAQGYPVHQGRTEEGRIPVRRLAWRIQTGGLLRRSLIRACPKDKLCVRAEHLREQFSEWRNSARVPRREPRPKLAGES